MLCSPLTVVASSTKIPTAMAPNDLSEHSGTRLSYTGSSTNGSIAPNERPNPPCHEDSRLEVPASTPIGEPQSSNANVASCGEVNPSCDARVGIVVERAANHFDRRNRRHPERPSRVASIVDTLTTRGLLRRCCLLGDDKTDELLQDEDYLRVHLPGYMQR
jgi:hypothetical protein